jgi:hypothetical protein
MELYDEQRLTIHEYQLLPCIINSEHNYGHQVTDNNSKKQPY